MNALLSAPIWPATVGVDVGQPHWVAACRRRHCEAYLPQVARLVQVRLPGAVRLSAYAYEVGHLCLAHRLAELVLVGAALLAQSPNFNWGATRWVIPTPFSLEW